ncbi:MAG: ArsR/SmtB family transcription factor [Actinomycetota bacterium]
MLPRRIDACQYVAMELIQTLEGCCPPVLSEPLGQDEAELLAQALKVVAEPARLRLLGLISSMPGREACVCHLTEPLGLSQPTVSHHLKVLHEAGLLEREPRGRWAFYRVVPASLQVLRDALGA